MSWITINAAYLQRRMPADYGALQRVAEQKRMDWDQTVEEVIESVVSEVRGYVQGHRQNTMGAAGSVPPECVRATLTLLRLELIAIVPGGPSLADELRVSLEKRAREYLAMVAKGDVAVTPPETLAAAAPDPATGKYGGDEAILWPDTTFSGDES